MKQWIIFFFWLTTPLQLVLAQCTEDCVWPGDLNANGIANSLDILALGIAFGEMGPARTNMSTLWEALDAEDWSGSLPFLGSNFKHCDADGDGEVTDLDRLPISINYNQTNDNFIGLLGNDLLGQDLFIVPQNTVAAPGESLIFDIHLGTAEQSIDNLYGIGFQVDLDTQYVEEVIFDFSETWIGSGEEVLGYGKYSDEIDHAATAITRLDGTTVSGFGKIAQMEIVITDVILDLVVDSTACLPFTLSFSNVLAIDAEEQDLLIASRKDSLAIKHPSQLTHTTSPAALEQLKIFPNPSTGQLYLQSPTSAIEKLRLYNALGQILLLENWTSPRTHHELFLPRNQFPPGMYWLEIQSGQSKAIRKIRLE